METASQDNGITEKKRVLLVDDEADIRDVLEIALDDLGYEVVAAANGKAALDEFESRPFPIVLTDIKMPGMDGIELLKQIKRRSPDTEIIMITGHGDMDLAIESFRNQAVEFITKPVDVQTLDHAMSRAQEKIKIRQGLKAYTRNLESLLLEKTRQLKESPSSETHRQAVLDSMEDLPLITFVIDRTFKLDNSNALFRQTFGAVNADQCYALCCGKKGPCQDCPAMHTFTTGESCQTEVHYTPPEGDELECLAWSAPIRSSHSGPIDKVIIMATDIRKVMDIQDHLTSLGLMIGSVSHGIKGLLTGLDGGVYMLNSALKKEDQTQALEGLETVQQMTSKIKKMILDILFYAKEREIERAPVPAADFARDLLQTMSGRATALSIALKSDLPETDVTFSADAGVLHSALINIFDNALDACEADPSGRDHEVTLKVRADEDQVRFSITDNGIGMEAKEIKKAFKLFHSAKGKQGTGLGLYITRHIIDQHNGSIEVSSRKNEGSTFTVTLPRH